MHQCKVSRFDIHLHHRHQSLSARTWCVSSRLLAPTHGFNIYEAQSYAASTCHIILSRTTNFSPTHFRQSRTVFLTAFSNLGLRHQSWWYIHYIRWKSVPIRLTSHSSLPPKDVIFHLLHRYVISNKCHSASL